MTTHRKKQKTFSGVSSVRWSTYAAAGAASAVVGASHAEAAIHVVDVNETFSAPAGSATTATFPLVKSLAYFSVEHRLGASGNQGFADFGVFCSHPKPASAAFNGATSHGVHYVSKLAAGADIAALPFIRSSVLGAAGSFHGAVGFLAVGSGESNSQWTQPGQGYVGFKFNGGDGTQYGWVSLTMSGAPINSFTLNSYAYGDPGDVVTAGEVPEPGSLALLAAGGAGLLAWRKRRALSAAKSSLPA